MSSIQDSLAATLRAMRAVGGIPEPEPEVVPEPIVEVSPEPTPEPEAVAEPVVETPVEESVEEPVVEQVAESEPEPEVIVADEVAEAEPAPVETTVQVVSEPVIRHMALRALAPRILKAAASLPVGPKIQASLTNLQTQMSAFGPTFKNANANTKVQEATVADNAGEIGGNTPAAQLTLMEADLDAHAASSGASHNVTPLQAGTYSKTQVDTTLKGRVPFAGIPLTRYGELSYLPIGVSGSFQGATMNFECRRYPGIIEDDGTYVFLRNGTTGSQEGVYYAYLKNALNAASMSAPVRTNFRYQPAFFPSGSTARWVSKSDGKVIVGRLQTSAGALSDYFLAITNGTFDASKHVGAVIPAANFPVLADTSCNVEAIVGNSNIYLIVSSSTLQVTSTPVEFQIWSIPTATVQAANGGNVTPTQLTGWTTTGFGGSFNGTTNVRVANKQADTNAANLPMVTYPASPSLSLSLFVDNNGNMCTDSAQDPSTGNIRIRVMGTYFASVPSSGYTITGDTSFWVNVNPTARTAALEGPATAPGTLTYNSGNQTVAYSGGMFNTPASSIIPQPYQGGTSTNTWAPSGYWVSITDSDPPDYGSNIARATCSAVYANRYIALAPSSTVTARLSGGFQPAYGTPLGGRMTGLWVLPGGYVMASSFGPKNDGVTMEWGPVVCQLGSAGYSYSSQYNGTLTGYSPAPFRTRISDMGQSVDNFTCMVSETAASGTVTASTGYFLEGYNTTGYASVAMSGNILTGSGSIGLTNAVLQNIKAACWTALGMAAPPASALEVVIPQNAAIPPFGLMTYTDASKNLFVVMFEFAITGGNRTGTITGMSVVSHSTPLQTDTGSVIQPLSNSAIWTTGACHIYEGSDAWFVGWGAKTYIVIPGTGAGHMLRFAIPKTTNRPDWSTWVCNVVGITYNANFYCGLPGVGFGYCPQNPTSSDNYTKITFIPTATTLAQFNAWANIGAQRVVVSQDVAQGWNVYFTDNQPLIMNGKYYTMGGASFNLQSIKASPANTTFYVYIVITNGVPAYVIQLTNQAESPTVLFIGTVVTGATGITATNMVKVTRLGNYRVTATKGGSSIPVSNGTPDASATLAWK